MGNERKNYLKSESGGTSTREKLNPPPPDLWIGHDQLELKGIDGDETVDTTLARSTSPDYRSASSMDRTRNYGVLAYSGNCLDPEFLWLQHFWYDHVILAFLIACYFLFP